ncbi:hypothetical protein A6E13_16580 [Aliivibrio fischeri]|nr:hypothetical protein A6E13_16580 [Aliivibrio fischeri]
MLGAMPLSDYYRWVKRIRQSGFPSRNIEMQLQQLNAGVLNASGRFKIVSSSDFSLQKKSVKKDEPTLNQNVLNQILGDISSLSFPVTEE